MASNGSQLTDSESGVNRQESVVTNIFGKSSNNSPIRERSRFFRLKLKTYIFLHKPVGCAMLYHTIILILIFFSIIALNIIDELAENDSPFNTNVTFMKIMVDTLLIVILIFEINLRLWSCDVNHEFTGFRGRLTYLKSYAFWRALDVFGILVFIGYVVNSLFVSDTEFDTNIRICHLTQVLQLHRCMYQIMKVIIKTITSQKYQLIIVIVFAFMALIVSAFCVYLTEREANDQINHFYDAFWMTFITFTTIGYGDVVPVTTMGKVLVVVCASFGVLFFALPGSILGTGLALQIQEDERRTQYYRTPAAKLIQSIWRSYATNQLSKSDVHWKLYRRKDQNPLTPEDRACIRFIRCIAYLKQRHRFQVIIGIANDDLFRERSTRELSRSLDLAETDVKHIGYNINKMFERRDATIIALNKLIQKVKQIKQLNQINNN